MTDFANLPTYDRDGFVRIVVESPRGSLMKLKFEPELQAFVFERALQLGVTYPYDWGFIPSTRAEDGDPLDAMVLFDAPTWPGVVIPGTPIGLISMTQRDGKKAPKERNDRVIALAANDKRYADVSELPKRTREELEHFFIAATALEEKDARILGWAGPDAVLRLLRSSGAAKGRRPKRSGR